MTKLILVRRGQSQANDLHIISGQRNFPLSELGHAQAEKAAVWLLAKEKITKIYSSDLLRAYQTATPTAWRLGLPIHCDPALREMDMGELVGLTKAEWQERFADNWQTWTEDYPHYRAPKGGSISELYDRSVAAISRILAESEGECVAVFCHMGVMRSFETYARGLSCDEIELVSGGKNASIAIYTYEDGKPSTVAYDLVEHLDETMTAATFGL